MKLFLTTISVLVLSGTVIAGPVTVSPSDFNVYSLGNIGTTSDPYGSDFQGITGSAGNSYFSGFTLTGLDTYNGTVLYTGGSASLSGGDFNGTIDIGGNAYLQSGSVSGNVYSGGDVSASGFSIYGDVAAAGNVNIPSWSASGTVTSGATYSPSLNHDALSQYFLDTSAGLAAMEDTSGEFQNNWGGLSYSGQSGTNILTLDSDTLKNAWGFTVNAPEDAVLYINVTGDDVSLDWLNWSFTGGIGADDVLLNYYEADTLRLDQGGTTNILAPNADLTYSSGAFAGSIVAGNLYGDGQINLGTFDHYEPIPEPATLILMSIAGLGLVCRKHIG